MTDKQTLATTARIRLSFSLSNTYSNAFNMHDGVAV